MRHPPFRVRPLVYNLHRFGRCRDTSREWHHMCRSTQQFRLHLACSFPWCSFSSSLVSTSFG
jgi:hypothetical protein